MYLLPVAVAAVALHSRQAWLIALLAMACYSLLVFFHVPLSHLHVHSLAGIGLDIHLMGMWLGFMVSSGLVAAFVTRIGQNLRDYDRLVAEAREKALDSERMLALGTLAAAAAHELGTPLATIAVVAGEMTNELDDKQQLASSLAVIRTQVGRCKEILTSITASAGHERAEQQQGQALDAFLDQTIARWHDLRPITSVEFTLQGNGPAPTIVTDRTLGQALTNLLDNAADAAATRLIVSGHWDAAELRLDIIDDGTGLAPEVAPQVGTPFFTTKQEYGMGLGLYLARTILGRFGGSITLENHAGGGAITRVRLPLSSLVLEGHA
jgi:two-component system sensor histidine kinase RegB